ncbi:hypothetical protein AAG570_007934 [Ranatra chinensis]|uniref:Small-subunit processome Utp12 domain-containing protein n=1 Tax=Ranatra chinensis TaxID=642074 RepID=A0ABD0Y6K9_9HEMI
MFQFSNILGAVYHKGDVVFSRDGNCVYSPVGNRISIFDLKNNKSSALAVEGKYNYSILAISPNGNILITVDEMGDAFLISLISGTLVCKHRFKQPVQCLKFSPDGKYFAACKGNSVHLFRVPGQFGKELSGFTAEKVFYGSFDSTTSIDWTSDSRILAVGSKDSLVRLYSIPKLNRFRVCTLSSHTDAIVSVFFEDGTLDINSISCNGRLCIWEANLNLSDLTVAERSEPRLPKRKLVDTHNLADDIDTTRGEERLLNNPKGEENSDPADNETEYLSYKRLARHFLLNRSDKPNLKLTTCSYHKAMRILVSGFSNGSFFIHELPDVNLIHSLSISDVGISKVAFNVTGDWIALGCEDQGQLIVWEWQSETYVMKQQGHSSGISSFSYSGDGRYIVTGGEDGKVKLWNTQTGFCFVTFCDHTSEVSYVKFAPNKKFFASASLDGTVRLNDMTRYRNFRTLTSTRPVQFISLAIDASSEFIAAGGQDVFEIYLWSVKIGKLLEILSGHEGPVVGLDFNPTISSTELTSVSWDKTVRIWNSVESQIQHETIRLNSDGLCVTYRPDGGEIAVATLDGQIAFFNVATSSQTGLIEGRNDLGSGRSDTDLIKAKTSLQGKAFRTICYSADGKYILAGGQSKNICIYSVNESIIVKKFVVTQNLSLDAVGDYIDRRKMTEFGNIALVENREDGFAAVKLPGVRKGDMAIRKTKPEIRVNCIRFSPTGQEWAAVTTEGLLLYSLNDSYVFDPFQLEETITPASILEARAHKNFSTALMMAIRLNDVKLVHTIIESVPPSDIELCVTSLAEVYVKKLFVFISNTFNSTDHVEFYLMWLKALIKTQMFASPSAMLALQKNLKLKYSALSKM